MEVFGGLKIVDFSWSIVGPMTSRYFADYGATVVRVESERHPDAVRSSPPFKDGKPGADRSSYYSNYNVNKYGMALDLSNPEAVILAKRLIVWADIILESFRPGTMKQWGLDYDSVRDLNPGLIYASSSMLGQTGPHRHFPGYGSHGASIAGFNEITGWADRPPVLPSPAYTDIVSPRFLTVAIMEALFYRRKTGKGRYIDQSQVESGLQFLTTALLDFSTNKRVAKRNGNRDPYSAPHGTYRCSGDDRFCAIAVHTDEEWQAFCKIIGKPDLASEPRFVSLERRKQNEDDLDRIVEEWTTTLPPEVVMNTLQQAGVAAGVVETAEDLHNDIQLNYRGHFRVIDHPIIGTHTTEMLPSRLSITPAQIRSRGPLMGEHNEYVCTRILGMSDEEFIKAVEARVFG